MFKPINKMKSIHSSVLKKMDVEDAMDFIRDYHRHFDGVGKTVYGTEFGNLIVDSDDELIYVYWESDGNERI